jgi:hypothetical protein
MPEIQTEWPGLSDLSPLAVLVRAASRAGRDHAMRYGAYTDMTIVTGTGLWHQVLNEARKMLYPPGPPTTTHPDRREGLNLIAAGGRRARVLPSPDVPDRSWKLTFDSGVDGEIG